jgi:hypothetical protein
VAPVEEFHDRLTRALPAVAESPVGAAGVTIIVVESVALAFPEPPPDTLTWFCCGELALATTFTVTVIGGKLALGLKTSPREQ